jgi:hypothetical protein
MTTIDLRTRPAEDRSGDRFVQAPINYLEDGVLDSVWYSGDSSRSKMPLRTEYMKIQDMRPHVAECSLNREGFCLVSAPTKVKNFRDPEEIKSVYMKELEEAVKRATGAKRVIVQAGGVVRLNERSPEYGAKGTTYPGRYAHVDYSDESGPQLASNALPPEERDTWMRGRVMVVNTWRALSTPPQDAPLAVCDARSVDRGDLIISHIVLGPPGAEGFRVQTNMVAYNPNHHWCYFSGMNRNELLLFRGYDSDPAHFTRVPHSAFDDPSAGPDAAPRESIDIRAIAYFGA